LAAISRAEKNAAMVRITLPEDNDLIIAATYRSQILRKNP
jgi:hypothetical protein